MGPLQGCVQDKVEQRRVAVAMVVAVGEGLATYGGTFSYAEHS